MYWSCEVHALCMTKKFALSWIETASSVPLGCLLVHPISNIINIIRPKLFTESRHAVLAIGHLRLLLQSHLVACWYTQLATSSMSSGPSFSPKAGMLFLPLVTWYLMASTLYPPNKYFSSCSFLIFFSATTLLLPPAWQAAQFAPKMASPFSRSAANAGRLPATAARRPNARPKASGFHAACDEISCWALDAGWLTSPLLTLAGAFCGTTGLDGPTKHHAAWTTKQAAAVTHTARIIGVAAGVI